MTPELDKAIWHFQNAKPSIQRMPQTPLRDEALRCFDRAEAVLAELDKVEQVPLIKALRAWYDKIPVMDGSHILVKQAIDALEDKEAECEALRKERDALVTCARDHHKMLFGLEVQREAAEAELKRIRAETIEECAKVADKTPPIGNDVLDYAPPSVVAAEIRALASEAREKRLIEELRKLKGFNSPPPAPKKR